MKPNVIQPTLLLKVKGRSAISLLGITIAPGPTVDLVALLKAEYAENDPNEANDNFYNGVIGATARIRKALEIPDGELYVKWKLEQKIDILEWNDPSGLIATNQPFENAILGFIDGYVTWIENDAASQNLPSADEKAALAGSEGIPSANNRFVTESDPRLSSGGGGGGGGSGGGVTSVVGIAPISVTAESTPQISLDDNGVTNQKLAQMIVNTIKGRILTDGSPQDLTVAQVTAILALFTDTLQGLVPPSGGGTSNFLRADGTWAEPPGGGGGSGLTHYQILARTLGS